MKPEQIIKQKCEELEKEKNIKILFAVENGSRAWRIDSKDSDYDIRFVFKRLLNDYLLINKRDEVTTASYDKKGNVSSQEGCYFDFVGFDIYKFARMLYGSNPQVIEWLASDLLYYGKKPEVFVEYAKNSFKPISLYFHYKSMCRQNYEKYLKSRSQLTYKKYLYAMRGLINAKWVARLNEGLPPINFVKTLNRMELTNLIPTNILIKLYELIKMKKKGKEKEIADYDVQIEEYIEEFLKDDSEAPKNKKLTTTRELDEEVLRIVKND